MFRPFLIFNNFYCAHNSETDQTSEYSLDDVSTILSETDSRKRPIQSSVAVTKNKFNQSGYRSARCFDRHGFHNKNTFRRSRFTSYISSKRLNIYPKGLCPPPPQPFKWLGALKITYIRSSHYFWLKMAINERQDREYYKNLSSESKSICLSKGFNTKGFKLQHFSFF